MTDSMTQIKYIFGSVFALANRLQKLGDRVDDYMTMKQWMLIAVISQSAGQKLTIGEAAAMIGTSHQNIKKMALLLNRQGFLDMAKHPADGRATVLSLTEYCVNYFAIRAGTEDAFLGDVFRGFDGDTLSGLYNGLRLLEKNIETMEKRSSGQISEEEGEVK
ncbi:MarR family transcriptional regulator [Diplocloster hominis]|uniref:MarR family winged helix-turn-helix transcriptional regulator n=1 Tax=Diplocloster hominis TaxID=3079010 RepID=UPI0031BA3CFD